MKVKPKMEFLIWSPGFEANSGGLIALGRLAHNLSLLGEKVYIDTNYKNPNWGGEYAHGHQFDWDQTILVYPEILCGSPHGGKHIVRWLLNSVGAVGGDASTWGENDMVYQYAKYFAVPEGFKSNGELRAFDLSLDFWVDQGQTRSGYCHLIRKGHYKNQDKHKPDSVCIDGYPNNDYLKHMFNTKELFVCYDSECFLAAQAALCGCDVIVIPKDGVSAEQWKERFPYFQVGIAYGEDDIEWARTTKGEVRDHLKLLEYESEQILTRQFVRTCRSRLE